jgi:hypothetical protein
MHRVRRIMKAKRSNHLVKFNSNDSDDSGWYVHPDGSYYYFIKNKDDWILAAGPLSQLAYNQVTSKEFSNRLLSQCNFPLGFEHENIDGDVFIDTKTKELYVSVRVDQIIKNSHVAKTRS